MASQWDADSVGKMLAQKAASSGGKVSANVFFDDSVPADELPQVAKRAIETAATRVGKAAKVEIGPVHRLAKSVSVSGDPAVIAELGRLENVKTVLPSEVDDIYPKPVKVKIVE
jgi:hypothetical protein